jgi:uncharacterized protein YukE
MGLRSSTGKTKIHFRGMRGWASTDQVLTNIDLGIQLASSLTPALAAVSPADAAIASELEAAMQGGMTVIKQDADAVQSAGNVSLLAKIKAVADSTKANLQGQLSASHVSDQKLLPQITAWVNLCVSILDAIPANLNPHADMTMPTAESFKARYDAEVCNGDGDCTKH